MADTARRFELVSADDYLRLERESSHRHEFVNGAIFAMSGGTRRHNLISVNLTTALTSHLPDRCAAYMADTKLRVRLERAEYYYSRGDDRVLNFGGHAVGMPIPIDPAHFSAT